MSTIFLSLALNYHLIRQSLHYVLSQEDQVCMESDQDSTLLVPTKVRQDLDAFPRFKGTLSHLLLEVQQSPAEVSRLKQLFKYWTKYPPCLAHSSPTNWVQSHITLTVLLQSSPTEEFAKTIRDHFLALPIAVQDCFRSFEIRHAQLPKPEGHSTLEGERENWRAFFWKLVSNDLKLRNPNHVLIISTDCIPIQPNWLNLLDYATRPPNEPYWIIGPLVRRENAQSSESPVSLLHISPYSIYNIADGEFARWYVENVKHYAEKMSIPLYDSGRWEMDIAHYIQATLAFNSYQEISTKLRLTNVLLDIWNSTIIPDQILETEPDVAIVCGAAPEL